MAFVLSLVDDDFGGCYSGCGYTLSRCLTDEVSASGVDLFGKWILVKDNVIIDYDIYRNDIAERNSLTLCGVTVV